MGEFKLILPEHMQAPTQIGNEISITGKWIPVKKGGLFRKSAEAKQMVQEWEDIHQAARNHKGMLSTEINHAIGEEAVLVHHVFENEDSLKRYFATTATEHMPALLAVAKPETHLIRSEQLNADVKQSLQSKNVVGSYGDYLYGYVKNNSKRPDPSKAIQVTAKWLCKDNGSIEELSYWWNQVGTDAYELEKGLVRFEAYKVQGENALIIHETFDNTDELQFHLSKGTANRYKKNLDKMAYPENYFFRGPVSWMIRTYSKFLNLPATYTSQGNNFTRPGGSMSDGLT